MLAVTCDEVSVGEDISPFVLSKFDLLVDGGELEFLERVNGRPFRDTGGLELRVVEGEFVCELTAG